MQSLMFGLQRKKGRYHQVTRGAALVGTSAVPLSIVTILTGEHGRTAAIRQIASVSLDLLAAPNT